MEAAGGVTGLTLVSGAPGDVVLTVEDTGGSPVFYVDDGGNLVFTGDVLMSGGVIQNIAAPSSSGDAANKAYVDAAIGAGIPITLMYQTNSAIGISATAYGISASSSLAARFEVPAGKSFKVLCASGCVDTGAGVGSWTMYLISRKNGATNTRLKTIAGAAATTIYPGSATGTLASPLVTYVAGDLIQVGFENDAGSVGTMGTNTKSVFVTGILC